MSPELPIALLKQVLLYLEAEDVARCAQVSKKWRDACYVESLWKKFCDERWKYWKWKPNKATGWRQIFLARLSTDQWAFEVLDTLTFGGAHYLANMKKLRQLGDNCRDVLLWILNHPNTATLTHSYFAKRVLQHARRFSVVEKWKAWRNGTLTLSNLHGFAMMVTFFNERLDIEDIVHEVDELAADFIAISPEKTHETQMSRFQRLTEFFTRTYPSDASVLDIETKLMYITSPLQETKQGKACVLAIVFEALAQRVGLESVEVVADREKKSFRRYHYIRYTDVESGSNDYYYIDFKKHSETGILTADEFDRHASQYYGEFWPEYKPIPQQTLFKLFLHDYFQSLTNIRGYSDEIIYGTAVQRQFISHPVVGEGDLTALCDIMKVWWSFVATRFKYPEDYELGRVALSEIEQFIGEGTWKEHEMWQKLANNVQADIEAMEANDSTEWDYSGALTRGGGERDPKFFIGDIVCFNKFDALGVVCRWDRAYDANMAENVAKFQWMDLDSPKDEPFYEVLTLRGVFLYCGEKSLVNEPPSSDRLKRMIPINLYGDYMGDEDDWELAKALGPITTESIGCYFERWDSENGRYIMNEATRKWFPDG
ncbi:4072_t:CDS:2 [Ambispora leptoticha]|uniref:4072_t:CDS:1 n=1 Tax=Ambispora leptoticha TaxID=144679 RepID=A0A9N9BGK8_9GLOM|nr:4072_t:CDS:2 [Ambispora leptoticha]